MRKLLALALLLNFLDVSPTSAATQIYKCITQADAVIFSDSVCPSGAKQNIQTLQKPMLIQALPKHVIQQSQNKVSTDKRRPRVIVVGAQSHVCGSHDPQARRTAMVRKQVKSGMSQADIESMYGKPLKQDINNGILTATYRSNKGQKRSVRFDEHGCVRLSQKSATANSNSKKTSTKKTRAKKNLQ